MMAGAEAFRSGAPSALALTRKDLADRAAASRERERLNRLASQWGLSSNVLAHLAMCVTLQGGCKAEDALQLVREEQQAMGFPRAAPVTELVNRLAEALLAPEGEEVDAVQPNLIGEAFLLQGMQEHYRFPELQAEIVGRAWRRAGRRVAAVLVRAAQDYAQGDARHCTVVWFQRLVDWFRLCRLRQNSDRILSSMRPFARVRARYRTPGSPIGRWSSATVGWRGP
jgi:hypothetical protein